MPDLFSQPRVCGSGETIPLCGHTPCFIVLAVQIEEVELKPGGSEIDVTESNKREYVK